MSPTSFPSAAGCLLAMALVAVPARAETPPTPSSRVEIVAPEALVRGQKGVGLSVFAGREPERFEVEVIGVMNHTTAELSYILARLSGQNLESSGVAQGMSGSPVYFDGRLAGAVSFSFLFAEDAIAGITPIAGMRRLDLAPSAAVPTAARRTADAVPTTITLDSLAAGIVPEGYLASHLDRLRPASRSDGRSTVHWQAAGFGEAATTWLGDALGRIDQTTGSGHAGDMPTMALVPGGSVALVLVHGDLNLAAHGTVTDVDGDRILAFGHPVLGVGPVLVPMAQSEVLTTVASLSNSFKVANVGPIIGAFDQDREPGARGRVGLTAPTIPVTMRFASATPREYKVEMANVGAFFPGLLGSTVLGALGSASFNQGEMAIDLAVRFDLEGHESLEMAQSFEGRSAGVDGAVFLMTYADYLLGNDFEMARLTGIDVTISQSSRPETETLVSAQPERRVVAPGEKVSIGLELQSFRGGRHREPIEIEVPSTLRDGRYVVLIGDGSSIDAARRTLVPVVPDNLAEALGVLRAYRSRRDLVVLGLVAAPGVSVAGEALPALPESIRAILAGGAVRDASPLALHIVDERVLEVTQPLSGAVRVDLEVRRPPR